MIDNISIRNKSAELSAKYANRHIDDFDTFVCARVADYFINNERTSTDTIYAAIEQALCDPIIKETADSTESVEDDSHSNIPPQPPVQQVALSKKLLKAAPYITGAAAIGFIAWALNRKKRK